MSGLISHQAVQCALHCLSLGKTLNDIYPSWTRSQPIVTDHLMKDLL